MIALLTVLTALQAQTIKRGDKFFDGEYLYVAELQQKGDIMLKGMDITGHQQDIKLRKAGNSVGEYILTQIRPDDQAPYGCLFGCRVQYVNQQGMHFLGFYVEEHCMGQTMVLTPDNIVNCTNQQRFAEQANPTEQVSNWLMNQKYLRGMSEDVLKQMVKKLQAKKKKTIIERTNQDLIAYALAMELYSHTVVPEADGDNVLDKDLPVMNVSNAFEFVTALGSNRVVNIKDNTIINLSDVLGDEELFTVYGRLWRGDYYEERKNSDEYIVSCERFDGRQLELVNVENLTIRGGRNSQLIVRPRYANVLNLYQCSHINIENLTIGHTEEGYCEGGVIYAEGSEDINITNCDLYGCGTYGLEAWRSHAINMENTIIRDCSYGIMELHGSQYCLFKNCDFVRCREFSLVYIDDACQETRFTGCRFAQNRGPLFSFRSEVKMDNCEIHHSDKYDIGTIDDPTVLVKDHTVKFFRDEKALKARKIGPKK